MRRLNATFAVISSARNNSWGFRIGLKSTCGRKS
jgi:hypothetical protein